LLFVLAELADELEVDFTTFLELLFSFEIFFVAILRLPL
jgi:hypothetical protein